jgi:hypothetical protein
MLSIEFDEKLGIMRIVSAGFSSDEEVEAMIRESGPLMILARARRGHVLHLVDASDTPVQSQAAMARFNAATAEAYRPGDRTAIVLQSALASMQSKRIAPEDSMGMFATEEEALAWLLGEEYDALASR